MEKVTGGGGWIRLGPWGPRGWSQRSRCEASYKADGPVMEITVHYRQLSPVSDTDSIDAISFQSKSRDVIVIGCSEIGSSCCQRKVRIDSSVEQLLSITMTYNTFYITSLTFHTNLNIYGPIGPFDEKDTIFSTPMDGGVIVGFHGCGEVDRNNRLLAIGVFVVPKVNSLHSIQDPNFEPSQDKKIQEELKSKIKELEDKVDAKNEVLRKMNEEMTKAAADLQKIDEELAKLKKEMEDVATENEALRKRNEVVEKMVPYIMLGISKQVKAPPTPQHPLSPMGDACSRMDLTAIHEILVKMHYWEDEGTKKLTLREMTQPIKEMLEARRRGDSAFLDKDFRSAIHNYSQFIFVGTIVSPTVHARRSLCHLLCYLPDAALRDAMQAQSISPDWPVACYMQSIALAMLDMHQDAADLLNEAAGLEEKRQKGGRSGS